MYAYCLNNPVNRVDSDGADWHTSFLLGLGLATVGLLVLTTLPFSGPLLAGAGVAAATVATAANATVAVGLSVSAASIAGSVKESGTKKQNPKSSQTDAYNGKDTKLKNGDHIDYEYNGNGTGNVHYQSGPNKYKIWDFDNGVWRSFEVPKFVERAIETVEGAKVVVKYIEKVITQSGFLP